MKGYIQTAVEQADNWSWRRDENGATISYRGGIDIAVDNEYYIQFALDALAAQLIRQAYERDPTWSMCRGWRSDTGNRSIDIIIDTVDTGVLA